MTDFLLLSDKRNVYCMQCIKYLKSNFLNTLQVMRRLLEIKYNIINSFI